MVDDADSMAITINSLNASTHLTAIALTEIPQVCNFGDIHLNLIKEKRAHNNTPESARDPHLIRQEARPGVAEMAVGGRSIFSSTSRGSGSSAVLADDDPNGSKARTVLRMSISPRASCDSRC